MTRQRGYVLYTVVIMLVIVAATVLLVGNDSAFRSSIPERDLEATQADYVAAAALQHAVWQKDNYSCTGDTTITTTSFGPHSYSATIDSAATAESSIINPDRDSWIKEAAPNDNFGGESELPVKNMAGGSTRALYHYDLSSLAGRGGVQSAIARFYVTLNDDQAAVEIRAVTAAWTESAVTWNNIGSSVDTTVMGTIPVQGSSGVWVLVDITALAQQWVNVPASNHGIALIATSDNLESRYSSIEHGSGKKPLLAITVAAGQVSPVTITVEATLSNGISRTHTRANVPAYKTPVVAVLQPDSVNGIDTYIWELSPSTNYGTSNDLWISSSSGNASLSLLKFNLDQIPTGVRVLSAKLSVKQTSSSDKHIPVTAHRIYSHWDEDFATWTQRDDGVSWTTDGGDLDATVIATADVGDPGIARFEWDIAELVEAWLNGTYPNFGVALRTVEPNIFGSKLDTSDHGDNKRYPSLTIEYACECGTACVAPQGFGKILMVIGDSPATPSAGDAALRDRFEAWGYTVSLIQDDDTQANFVSALSTNNAAFVSASVDSANVGSKLTATLIGVVNAKGEMNGELGIASAAAWPVGDEIQIVDVSHYITSVFPLGPTTINRGSMEGLTVSGIESPGAKRLADWGSAGALLALEAGNVFWKTGSAEGRRVMVPLGREANIHPDYWTNNGSLIVQRALAWAAAADVAGRRLLMVVGSSSSLTAEDIVEKDVLESWGYSVRLINSNAAQIDFNEAVSFSDVVLITDRAKAGQVGAKLTAADIGVVLAQSALANEFGFSDGVNWNSGTELTIDNNYFVTSPLPQGQVSISSSSEDFASLSGDVAPQIQVIGLSAGGSALVAMDTGAETINGIAAGRRILLPWGGGGMAVGDLNASGLAIFERAIRWASDPSGSTTSGYFFTTERDATLGDLSFADVDIVSYLPWNDTESLFFDGGSTTLVEEINALHILANGDLLLSTKKKEKLGGLDVKEGDLVVYDIASDQATLVFEGKKLFADDKSKVVSVHLLDNGHYILSTDKPARLGGLSFTDRDLVEYDPVTDTASLFFDGSTTTLNNDISGVQVLANGHFLLSAKGSTTLGGLSFGAADLIDYDPVDDVAVLVFDGTALLTTDSKISSVHIGFGSGEVGLGGGGVCDGNFLDKFDAISFSGSDGSLDWTGDWVEVGESGGAASGDIVVKNDESNYQLRTRDNPGGGAGVERELDLSGASSATLSYRYRRDLKGSGDYTKVEIRDGDAADPWSELTRYQGPVLDGNYLTASHDITSYVSTRTQLRFITAPTMGGNEEVWFDDIQVLCE